MSPFGVKSLTPGTVVQNEVFCLCRVVLFSYGSETKRHLIIKGKGKLSSSVVWKQYERHLFCLCVLKYVC